MLSSTLAEQPFIEQKRTLKQIIKNKEDHFRKASIFPVIVVIGYFIYSIYSIVIYSLVLASANRDETCHQFRSHIAWIVAANVLQFLQVFIIGMSLSLRKKWIMYLSLAWTGLLITLRFVILKMLLPVSQIEYESEFCYADAGSEKFDWKIYVIHLILHTIFDIIIALLLIFMLKIVRNLLELNRQLQYYDL